MAASAMRAVAAAKAANTRRERDRDIPNREALDKAIDFVIQRRQKVLRELAKH